MTNKELEKLFQNKLGGRKVDFNPKSWEAMERMLDRKMPVTPWYVPFTAWIKGLTAAMVVGFSTYFLVYQPAEITNQELNNKNGVSRVHSEKQNNSTDQNSEGNELLINEANNLNNAIAGGANQSPSTLSEENNDLGNEFAVNDGDGKGKRRRRKRKINAKDSVPDERFSDKTEVAINGKPNPSLDIEYVIPSLNAENSSEKTKATEPKRSKASPIKVGFTFSAISAKNLLPESEGKLNTQFKPAFALGVNLAQPLSKNWGMALGLNYKWQKAEGQSVLEETNYSFGQEITTTSINYNALHSLEIPLEAYYLIHQKHKVSGGLYASYLWAAQASYNRSTIKDFGTELEKGQFLNNNAIKDVWDIGITGGYSYFLGSRVQIGLESWVGLKPLQYDEAYDLKSNNFQLRFKFNYWLF